MDQGKRAELIHFHLTKQIDCLGRLKGGQDRLGKKGTPIAVCKLHHLLHGHIILAGIPGT